MKIRNWLALGVLGMAVIGCEEKAEQPAESAEVQAAQTEEPAAKAAEAAPAAEEKPSVEDGERAKDEAERAKEQAEVEANPLTACCRALGQRGFTERNPDYMKASKACGVAMEKKQTPEQALPEIKKELGSSALPSECG